MKKQYVVAENAFTLSIPEGLTAWETLEPRFRPFEVAAEEASCRMPMLSIEVTAGALPEYEAERIYEPEFSGVGFITSQASRMTDGTLIIEFRHIDEEVPRVMMKMPPQFTAADIVINPAGDNQDSYFLTHAILIAFTLAACGAGALMIHASVIIYDGQAYLFQGRSGTGKSTHASLWTRNIPGVELLNDDHPVIRFSPTDGRPTAYGSPWSGKTHCYRNHSAPIGAFVRIIRDKENELRPLTPLQAYASLTASAFYLPFFTEALRDMRHQVIERLVCTTACYEMYCRPDADAALTCRRGLSEIGS